jgi:hypothetical protein
VAKLDISSAASAAEIIASIAVVVSLIFVANSIDQNTAALQASNDNFLYELQYQQLSDARSDGELAAIIVKFRAGEKLTDVEELRYKYFEVQTIAMWEISFLRYKAGLLPPRAWETWDRMWTADTPDSYPEEWWSKAKYQFDKEFVAHVDAVYARR